MADEPTPGVIGSLPRSRPHRRSDKRVAKQAEPASAAAQPAAPKARAAKPAAATARTAKPSAARARAAKPSAAKPAVAKPRAVKTTRTATPAPAPPPPAPKAPARPAAEPSPGVVETAVQAAAELAEIGLHAGARALRRAVSRLPRP